MSENNIVKQKKLTQKEKTFCHEYIIDFNATRSALKAGYSKNTAGQTGYENLKKPYINEYIESLLLQRAENLRFTAQEVLERLANLSRASIGRFFESDGRGGFEAKSGDDLTEEDLYCIQEITIDESIDRSDENIINKKTKFKLTDRIKALELAGKHVGIQAYVTKKEIEVKEAVDDKILQAREKRERISKIALTKPEIIPASDE